MSLWRLARDLHGNFISLLPSSETDVLMGLCNLGPYNSSPSQLDHQTQYPWRVAVMPRLSIPSRWMLRFTLPLGSKIQMLVIKSWIIHQVFFLCPRSSHGPIGPCTLIPFNLQSCKAKQLRPSAKKPGTHNSPLRLLNLLARLVCPGTWLPGGRGLDKITYWGIDSTEGRHFL